MRIVYRGYYWCENQRRPDARADRLAQHELIVFGRQTGHHKAKDVEKGPNRDGKAWAILVEESPTQGRDEEHAENYYQSAIQTILLRLKCSIHSIDVIQDTSEVV
jgi:hypothetical protein